MEMVVMLPPPSLDFNFDSSCTSPFMSAPSSPPRFGTPFFSAPTSPTHSSSSVSAVPFNWEEKPGLPKSPQPNENDQNADFAFDFSGHLDKHYVAADELFDGGIIKSLKPPPCSTYEFSPKSPRSPKKTFKEAFSPRSKNREFDPFAEAFKNTSMQESQRGRKHTNLDSRHHKTRSLSPFRVSDLLFDQETEQHQQEQQQKTDKTSPPSSSSSSSWYRRWKIKDLLLFRSASEGRPSSKAQLNKYAILKKPNKPNNDVNQEDDKMKNLSFRSVDSTESSVGSASSSVIASSRRRSGVISAHELHYTINRAVSEEMKKKTFLPYKQGLLGCLGFQPAATDISRAGLGSMTRG